MSGFARHGADEADAVMVGAAAHEHHAARHHLVGINVRHLEAQHLGIKAHRALDIAALQHDMADLLDAERHVARPGHRLQPVRIEFRHRLPRLTT
jgi:hypothetical protein